MEPLQNYSKICIKTSNRIKPTFYLSCPYLVDFLGFFGYKCILLWGIQYCKRNIIILRKFFLLTQGEKKTFREHHNNENFRLCILKVFGISWAPQGQWLWLFFVSFSHSVQCPGHIQCSVNVYFMSEMLVKNIFWEHFMFVASLRLSRWIFSLFIVLYCKGHYDWAVEKIWIQGLEDELIHFTKVNTKCFITVFF